MHKMLRHGLNVFLRTKNVVSGFRVACFRQGRPAYDCAISGRCQLTFAMQNTKLFAAKTC